MYLPPQDKQEADKKAEQRRIEREAREEVRAKERAVKAQKQAVAKVARERKAQAEALAARYPLEDEELVSEQRKIGESLEVRPDAGEKTHPNPQYHPFDPPPPSLTPPLLPPPPDYSSLAAAIVRREAREAARVARANGDSTATAASAARLEGGGASGAGAGAVPWFAEIAMALPSKGKRVYRCTVLYCTHCTRTLHAYTEIFS
jgi:hypothetical protein